MPALTLFVSKLPTSATGEHLGEIFSEIGPLKNSFVVREKGSEKCRGIGYVTFSMEEDGKRALKEVKEYDGQKIVVVEARKKPNEKKRGKAKITKDSVDTESPKQPTASPKQPTESPKQPAENQQKFQGLRKSKLKSRLIIRNLSFKCTEDDLKKVFSEFGVVHEAKIALKPDGKMRGFAFVQFQNMPQAAKALAAMNLKEIKGRPIAVDWAIPKDKYIATQSGSKEVVKVKSEDTGDDGEQGAMNKPLSQQKAIKSEEESEEDEDDEPGSGEEDEEENDESDSEVSDEDDDDDDDDDDDEDSEEESNGPPKKKVLLPSDVNEGRTIFIRNLSFDTEEEELEKVLLRYGEMKYVRIVMHANTGHSKGVAFAQFKSKEAAEKCIAAAQDENESGGIRVDGRKLNITAAVTREDAAKLKDKKIKTHTGARNLYLAREGLIRPGTKAAEEVSETDMAKRTRFQELKRQKLKDISVYVSKTRLCVHNLPKSVQQPKLRKICLKAAGDKGARITECRVMYDKKPVRGKVMGQSLGYGFVEFKEHEHALQVLRHLNNNPDIFGPQKRPIVEFSLEDSRKLKLKATRLQNSKRNFRKDNHQEGGKPQHSPGKKKNEPAQKGIMGNVGKQEKVQGSLYNVGKQEKAQGSLYNVGKQEMAQGSLYNVGKQELVQGSLYKGFMTKPEVEHIELQDGKKRQKVLHMPSHRGPKIRKRDKGKQPVQLPKLKKGPSRKDKKMSTFIEKPNQNKKQNAKPAKRKFQNKEDVRFDSLVERYKKKLIGNSNAKTIVKKSKWFS